MNDETLRRESAAVEQPPLAEHHVMPRDRLPETKRMNPVRSVIADDRGRATALLPTAGKMDAESFAALSLAPLVAIAGAKGSVHDKERSLVLAWARDAGLRERETAYRLVEQWLVAPRSAELLTLWKTYYVARLSLTLTREARRAFKGELLKRATALIEATGAFSGIGHSPSQAEQALIDEIDAALS